jgi:hypothetical protein
LGWVQAGEVALDEAKYEDVADGAERDDEDDEKRDKREDVEHGTAESLDLARLQRPTCRPPQLSLRTSHLQLRKTL